MTTAAGKYLIDTDARALTSERFSIDETEHKRRDVRAAPSPGPRGKTRIPGTDASTELDAVADILHQLILWVDDQAIIRGTEVSAEDVRNEFTHGLLPVGLIASKLHLKKEQVWAAILCDRWLALDELEDVYLARLANARLKGHQHWVSNEEVWAELE